MSECELLREGKKMTEIDQIKALVTPDENGLIPCGHCGGKAKILPVGQRFRVYCKKPRCSIGPSRKTKSEAVAAWNTRAVNVLALCQALEGAIHRLEKLRACNIGDDVNDLIDTELARVSKILEGEG